MNNTKIAQADFNLNDIKVPATPGAPIDINNTNIGTIISKLLPYIFTIAGMLLLIYLIFGGFQLMLSRGDPKAAQSAKSHITNALIGFIIVFIAFWVVQIFGRIFGLQSILDIFVGQVGGKQ